MSLSPKPALRTPTTTTSGTSPAQPKNRDTSQQFVAMALTMSWQLAVVVLVPLLAGVALDHALGTKYICTLTGLVVALLGMGIVLWRTLQTANSLPVPKLTAAERREVQKRYEEDDD